MDEKTDRKSVVDDQGSTRSPPTAYKLYVLVVMMALYLINQMDRFVLGIGSREITNELQFGDMTCHPNLTLTGGNESCQDNCSSLRDNITCLRHNDCSWSYSATGLEYQFLAGPAFTLIFTTCALPMGFIATFAFVPRKIVLSVLVVLWSSMALAAGFAKAFWQLLLARIGLGIFESGCTAFATGIISDYFSQTSRGGALAFYNLGLYTGYSLAFVFNFLVENLNWRWAFWVASIPGIVLGVVVMITVKEPQRKGKMRQSINPSTVLRNILQSYLQVPLLLLCVGGGLRRGGLLLWVYNVKAYFQTYYCDGEGVGVFLSWVPLVGGSVGAILGGVISDRLAIRWGKMTRPCVLILSQLLAIPFLVGVLNLPPPWAFLMLLPAYLIGEMWIGVCYATVLDQVPHRLVSSAVVLWLFINNNIAGGITLLVPVVERYVGLRYSLLILFPGCYLTATVLFSATLLTLCCRAAWKSHKRGPETKLLISESNSKSCNENYLSKTSQYTSINHDQK